MRLPYSRESLVAFLESKDPNEEYTYLNFLNCLHAQYLAFLGVPRIAYTVFFPFLALLPFERVASRFPHTFGAALSRVQNRALKGECHETAR